MKFAFDPYLHCFISFFSSKQKSEKLKLQIEATEIETVRSSNLGEARLISLEGVFL